MSQSNATRIETANQDQGDQTKSFSKKAPTIVYDNGH